MYDRGECRTHWRDLITSRVDSRITEPKVTPRTRAAKMVDERSVAKELYGRYPNSRAERSQVWEERTGKSERALYRRASELGLEAPVHHPSFEDFEDFARESGNLSSGAD